VSASRSPHRMLNRLLPRGSTRRATLESFCYCRCRTVVRERPIFDALAHAPGQPFACNLKIAMSAAGRVVRQTVVDLLARYDKANHSQRQPHESVEVNGTEARAAGL
jgi:hypothetical protein